MNQAEENDRHKKKKKTPRNSRRVFIIVNISPTQPTTKTPKGFLHDVAKAYFPGLYSHQIETGTSGQSNTGQEIPVNSVGRLLFGVPGHDGCMIIRKDVNNDIVVYVPERSPKEAHDLVKGLKKVIES